MTQYSLYVFDCNIAVVSFILGKAFTNGITKIHYEIDQGRGSLTPLTFTAQEIPVHVYWYANRFAHRCSYYDLFFIWKALSHVILTPGFPSWINSRTCSYIVQWEKDSDPPEQVGVGEIRLS